jgi:hypothetical protein
MWSLYLKQLIILVVFHINLLEKNNIEGLILEYIEIEGPIVIFSLII